MKRNFSYKAVSLLAFASVALSCSQDRSLADYKKQQAQNDLAKLSAPSGRYSGVLSDSSGNPLGAMQLTLTPRFVANPNSDGTVGTAAASLVGTIDYMNGTTSLSFVTQTSNYDETTGIYSATISIPTTTTPSAGSTPTSGNGSSSGSSGSASSASAGPSQTLTLTATIRGDQITGGTIESATSSSHVLYFTLQKNGSSIGDVAAKVGDKAASANPTANQVVAYIGATTFNSGESRPVQIQILKDPKRTAEDFLGLILYTESVTMSLNYGPGVGLASPATRDLNQGYLKGILTVTNTTTAATNAPSTTLTSDCRYSNNNKTLKCDHYSTSQVTGQAGQNSNGSVIAQTTATLSSNNQTVPVTTTTGRESNTKTYMGYRADAVTGKRTSQREADGHASSRVDLMVTFLPKSRMQQIWDLFFTPAEETVIATVIAYADDVESSVAIPVQNVTWDRNAGTLSGTGTLPITSGPSATVTLDCSNFLNTPTSSTKSAFVCDYISNENGAHIHFVGAGK